VVRTAKEVQGEDMKMTIEKAFTFTIDTGKERKRIEECFKDRKMMKKKLLKLMDLVEAEKWEAAYKELEGKYWNGYDAEQECPRVEFIGMLDADGLDDPWDTYTSLIWRMVKHPDIYKVVKKVGKK